jgi:hypothetical protein
MGGNIISFLGNSSVRRQGYKVCGIGIGMMAREFATAGSSQRLKREAQLFIEDLERQDRLARRKQPEPDEPDPQPFTGPRTFGEFAQSSTSREPITSKRAALTDGARSPRRHARDTGPGSRIISFVMGRTSLTYFESEAFPDAFTDWLVRSRADADLEGRRGDTRKPAISCISSSQKSPKIVQISPSGHGDLLVLLPMSACFMR